VIKSSEKEKAFMGMTEYAMKMLHDILYVSLPEAGVTFRRGGVCGVG